MEIDNHIIASSLAKMIKKAKKPICYITSTNAEARMLCSELALYLDQDLINYFPESEILPYDHFSPPESIIKSRFKILNSNKKDIQVIVSSVKNLFERYQPKSYFDSLATYKVKDEISINEIKSILLENHFIYTERVDKINQFSQRGGLLDIWSPIYPNPLRVEFFDDEIESIRFFNQSTQLTINEIDNFNLTNGSLVKLDDLSIKKFRDSWRENFHVNDERVCNIFNDLCNKNLTEGYEIYLPLFFDKTSSFVELFSNYDFFIEEDSISNIRNYWDEINTRYVSENIDSNRPLLSPNQLFFDLNKVISSTRGFNNIKIDNNFQLIEKTLGFKKNLEQAINELSKQSIKKIVVSTTIPSEYEKLKLKYGPSINEFENINDITDGFNLTIKDVFRPLNDGKSIYLHKDFFDHNYIQISSKSNQDLKIDFDINFNKEDYVIHEDYGLGIYQGLEVVETNKKKNEYLKITYAKNEHLYVPLSRTFLLSKYHKSSDNLGLVLDSLSSNKWDQRKQKAKKRAYDHAAEILDVESRRLTSHSPSLRPNAKDYEDFNKEFPYKETDDQIKVIKDIEKDLSLIKPMNRLLCGDVGFGKTEIAMRAAFISVSSGKQVVILAPSTVLVAQHYQSFLSRYKEFGVNIQFINRHTKGLDRTKTIDDFNNQKIDILIGTHTLFNQSISYENAGLFIIDEEHRFGAKQKDVIKSKKPDVHVLYLSATPIPRTMNFIFAGLKDFSFLHTPPTNRLSIKSFLRVENDNLISEAINREISRDGQCFVIQNDIHKLASLKEHLLRLMPKIKIEIAHGQLKKKDITNRMDLFKLGKIDVLLCTTIVEMGLDIPNANTMIILDSYNFGLAQLHQLRGRVGRSSKQGYCYFLIPTNDIPKKSKNRLDSIIRLSELGSGYFIAQEDLELRGGGEILGEKQSGHVDYVGISLYLSMLKESIETVKNPQLEIKKINTEINFFDEAFIPDQYLPSPTERLKIYRRINEIKEKDNLDKLKIELIDRCGKHINEVDALFSNAELILLSKELSIDKISSHKDDTRIYFNKKIDDQIFNKVLELIKTDPGMYKMSPSGNLKIEIENNKNSNQRRKIVRNLLHEII